MDSLMQLKARERGMVRESRYSNTYYTSTNPAFGKITFEQFIETEVEERGNYTQADVQRWAIKYHISPGDKVIWVSPKKWVANRYNLFAEEWDTAESIPESEMSIYEIREDEGFIIPESDDGDEGYLFVYKRNMNYMVREVGNQGTSLGTNERIANIIEDVKTKPWTVPQKRSEIVARLKSSSDEIDRKIITGIRSFRPIGTLSEFGAAMGAEPRKGVRIDTLMGATIFDEKRVPSKERVDRWDAEHKEAERIRGLIPEYAFGLDARPNTVTGNFRIVEHARRLKEQGLLSQEEELILNALEKYWQEHSEFDREKGYGVWAYNLEIMMPERLKEKATSKQPWEMTKSEAIAEAAKPLGSMGISWGEMRTALSTSRKFAESLHKDMVKLAIVEGKPVPSEVLKEYPDLINKEKEKLGGTGMAGKPRNMYTVKVYEHVGVPRPVRELRKVYDNVTLEKVKEIVESDPSYDYDIFDSQGNVIQFIKLFSKSPDYTTWSRKIDEERKRLEMERKPVPSKYPNPAITTTPKVFTYFFRNRPPDIGTYPKGAVMKEAWLPKRKTPKGNMAFGWASYDRELTPEEIKSYELFVDETVMPKLVAELIKYTHDEGITEGYKELFSKTGGWSEYGHALMNWLKANNEWKPDKGEQAEFLRHLARLTGKTPETKIEWQMPTKEAGYMPTQEDHEKAKLFLSALPRFTLDELIQQEATVRRWSIRFPDMEKELEDEYKLYLELRRAEKATAEATRKERASKPHTEQAKELYKQMRKTNSVRELDDWRNRVLFEAHLPDVEEDILLRDLAAKWRTYLETRGIPALEKLDKLPIDYKNEDYYFGTEVWIHPTTTIFDDQPLKGKLHQALNGGELFEVAIEGREGTQRTQIEKIYVTKVVEKPEPRYQPPIKVVTTTGRKVYPEQAIKIAADSIEQLRRVDVFRVLNEYSNISKELGDYIKSKRPDLVDEVNKILGIPPAKITPPVPTYIQLESTEALYKRYTSGYSTGSLFGIATQDSKDLAHSIGYELKLDTTIYTPAVLLRYAEQFKELAQRVYDREKQKYLAQKEKEAAEKEKEMQEGGQAFWDEVKNLKVVDFEVQHDINPDKPSRNYYHVYDRTFAILENGKKVQISYVIYKGEEGKRAAKATKEFYMRIYGQYIGKPLSEWVTEYREDFIRTNMESYRSQQPKPRFTFIPEVPVTSAGFTPEIKTPAPKKEPPEITGKKAQSPEEIKREIVFSIQDARTIEELQQIKTQIPFLPLPESDKRQITEQYQRRYSAITGEIPFGVPIKAGTEVKPMILGALTPQQQFEAEQRRKAAAEKRARGQKTLTSAGSRRLSEFGIGERAGRYYQPQKRYV